MEQEKNNKGVIALLVVLIVLVVLCVLFATGTISFKSNETGNNQSNGIVVDNGIDPDTNETGNNQSNGVIVDNDIDLDKVEQIYNILGIDNNETRSLNHCLNYNLSANDYLNNSKKIFSLYAMINGYNEYNISNEEKQKIMYCDVVKSDNCSSPQTFFGAAAARVISKPRANEIITKY